MERNHEPLCRFSASPAELSAHPGRAGERHHELRFGSLFDPGRCFSFPCDAQGRVRLDGLSERQRESLQRVLSLVGREYAAPQMVALAR
jgi:hypothetical protein